MYQPLKAIDNDNAPRSQASAAYEAIRADILNGRHAPDTKLKIADLANELGVSPGAVREALSRIVPEQLVVSRDQRGFVVAPLSISDLEDLTDLRCEVEAIALRKSLEHGDLEWEAALIAAGHRLRSTPANFEDRDAAQAWINAHTVFHHALIAGCGSPRLLALHSQLYEQSARYRGMTSQIESDRDIPAEHQEIMDLALARDADALVAAMTQHLKTTTALIVQAVKDDAASAAPDRRSSEGF